METQKSRKAHGMTKTEFVEQFVRLRAVYGNSSRWLIHEWYQQFHNLTVDQFTHGVTLTIRTYRPFGKDRWPTPADFEAIRRRVIAQPKVLASSSNEQYQTYLRSEIWRHFRDSLFPTYCRLCRNEAEELHHLTYVNLGHETEEDVMPLCSDCHAKIHGKAPDIK